MKSKNNQKPLLLLVATLWLGFSSCYYDDDRGRVPIEPQPEKIEGYAPVYGNLDDVQKIKSSGPAPIVNEGKIYIKGDMLYQIESGKGIHVINLKTPSNPEKSHFIEVTGAQEMAIKDNNLYTNNLNDLVVLDISNLNDVKVLDRVSGVFHLFDPKEPPATGWYECVDASKGDVIGWELKTLNYPKCRK